MALAQCAPGPLAAQLGIYSGFVQFRILGATLAGLAVIVIATRSILDIPNALIAVATILVLLYIKKLQEPYVIAVAAVLGIFIKLIL